MHPEWMLTLWDDIMLSDLQLENQELYDKSTNYGMKSDILRYEASLYRTSVGWWVCSLTFSQILYQYGGVYIDIDYECIASLNHITKSCSFFVGLSSCDVVEVNNGIMGYKSRMSSFLASLTSFFAFFCRCRVGHPLLREIMTSMRISPPTLASLVTDHTSIFSKIVAFIGEGPNHLPSPATSECIRLVHYRPYTLQVT